MRVLVTGGAGFIGSALVQALLKRGDDVRVLDDLSSGRRARLAPLGDQVDLRVGDVRDPAAVREAVSGCEAVLHQAALVSVPRSVDDPGLALDVNLGGTVQLLQACVEAGVERFVLASSAAVYGDAGTAAREEEDALDPLSPYAVSKLAAEDQVSLFARRHGLLGLSLRYFNVYGPGQDAASEYAAVVPAFIAAVVAGRPPVVHGDGGQTRDLAHVDDVVRANLAALAAPPTCAGRAYNIGSGRAVTIRDLALQLCRLAGLEASARSAPARAGDVRHSVAAVDLARRELGFAAERPLDEGLADLLAGARA